PFPFGTSPPPTSSPPNLCTTNCRSSFQRNRTNRNAAHQDLGRVSSQGCAAEPSAARSPSPFPPAAEGSPATKGRTLLHCLRLPTVHCAPSPSWLWSFVNSP